MVQTPGCLPFYRDFFEPACHSLMEGISHQCCDHRPLSDKITKAAPRFPVSGRRIHECWVRSTAAQASAFSGHKPPGLVTPGFQRTLNHGQFPRNSAAAAGS